MKLKAQTEIIGEDNESKTIEKEFHIPFGQWYLQYFTDRVIILTGSGRSGTSVLGRIVGTMRPMYYHFEPNLPKFTIGIPDMCRCLFYEDYQLPMIQGRHLNQDPNTESYSGHYWKDWEIKARWNLKRRLGVFEYLKNENAKICIKLTEFQSMKPLINEVFPGVRFLHIIRNGNDVIGSSLRPGWYNDLYMAANVVDWVEMRSVMDAEEGNYRTYNIPYFVSIHDPEAADYWHQSNHETRIAIAWRCATEPGIKPSDDYRIVRYEDLLKFPDSVVEGLRIWVDGVGTSEMTNWHIDSIKNHKSSEYPDYTDKIEEPERTKYLKLMNELGYK